MYPKMRVGEQLEYFARLARRSDARELTDLWLERIGLSERRSDEVQALSSGNQQRLQLAIALVHDPRLVILDEPFSGLDPIAVETMKQMLLEQLERGVTVLLSSHQLDLVSDVCSDVVIVSGGRVVLEGAVAPIRESSKVRDARATFASGEPSAFVVGDEAWEIRSVSDRAINIRVPAGTEAADVFAAMSKVGRVVEFAFGAPELSEVCIDSVNGEAR
jgi:ABC-2 type transport system ATP-binding protein